MTQGAYLLPLCVEWAILVTSLVPLVAWRIGNKHPNIAIFSLFAALLSAVVAVLLGLWIALASLGDLWMRLSAEPASRHDPSAVGLALLTAMAPWALLALAGITIALVNLRIEPAITSAKAIHPRMVSALTTTGDFEGVRLASVPTEAAISFTTRVEGHSTIVVSTGALARLTATELEAVHWHELGHIRLSHNALKLVAQALNQVTPRIAASRVFASRLEALCELAADNFAAKRISRELLGAARAKFD